MNFYWVSLTAFVIFIDFTFSYNILALMPFPGRSHLVAFQKAFKILALRGHNLTVISYFPSDSYIPNYREINIGGLESFKESTLPFTSLHTSKYNRLQKYRNPLDVKIFGDRICENFFESQAVSNFFKEQNTFDLIVAEDFLVEWLWTVTQRYKCPVVRLFPCALYPWSGKGLSNPVNPAYIPTTYMPYNDKMSFLERVENTLGYLTGNLYYKFVATNSQRKLTRKYFGHFQDKVVNGSLMLTYTHFSLNLPRPMVPSVIEVGGMHIEEPKPLPEKIEKWINESTHGVVYFSFGTLIKANSMPKEKLLAFINAFNRLPQRFIWKRDEDGIEENRNKIMISKWLPQFDIISHPNVKVIISHGGLLSITEAVHCGVPVLVIPQFGDQPTNGKALERVGGGIVLQMEDVNEEIIYRSLVKLLQPSYQAKAKVLSERFRDRPVSPLDTAVFWLEYAARRKGANFMKTGAVEMPWYQYHLLDVAAIIFAIMFILFFIGCIVLRIMFKFIMKSQSRVKKSKML